MKEEKDDDEFVLCLDRFPSRNSSMSCSSRLYYRSCEGVPFQWEMQPGTPKNNPPLKEAVPPPISPPPAALSLGFPKPPPTRPVQNKQPLFVFGPWRKYSNKSKKHSCSSSHKFDDPRFGSDCEFIESSCKAKSSSSSDHWWLGCGPWTINTIKIAIGRRV